MNQLHKHSISKTIFKSNDKKDIIAKVWIFPSNRCYLLFHTVSVAELGGGVSATNGANLSCFNMVYTYDRHKNLRKRKKISRKKKICVFFFKGNGGFK